MPPRGASQFVSCFMDLVACALDNRAPMSYQLTIEQRPGYVHTKAVGERTPENALRFLRDSYNACVNSGRTALLLEMQLSGPPLSTTSIFDVISDRVADGLKLRKIAYVDGAPQLEQAYFAETVAMNRGVNVRLFLDVTAAASWLAQDD